MRSHALEALHALVVNPHFQSTVVRLEKVRKLILRCSRRLCVYLGVGFRLQSGLRVKMCGVLERTNSTHDVLPNFALVDPQMSGDGT